MTADPNLTIADAGGPAGLALTVEPSRARSGPPGVIFFVALTIEIAAFLDSASRGSVVLALVALLLWVLLAVTWLIRFVFAVPRLRSEFPWAHWLRWLAGPAALALVFLLSRSSVPFDVRFALSHGAMDQAAADVMAGGSTDRGWIGLYPVERVKRVRNGMQFVIVDNFLATGGFLYLSVERPMSVNGDDYEALGGGWWRWDAVSFGSHSVQTEPDPSSETRGPP